MGTKFSVIVTTYSKERTGAKIIDALLRGRLAACIQVLPMRSFYSWKGKVSRSRESLMLIKARSRHFGQIRDVIIDNHDYDVPEIVSLRIDKGSPCYLKWMDDVSK
jgi:periplasmic divalent cation tolerance protein